MIECRPVADPTQPGDVVPHDALAGRPLNPARIEREHPDAHWIAVRNGLAVARASLWWRGVAPWPDATLGYVGHYAAADVDAGRAILTHAAAELARRGVTRVVAPLDGSTWHAYRLVVERGDVPPFFLEPQNPDDWPAHFEAAGFDVFARYTSALVDAVPASTPAVLETKTRLEAAGYRIRPIDPRRSERDLDRLFELSLAAFARNLLYTPIARDEFLAQYAPILPKVDPRLVLLAERDSALAGYCFAVPDLLEVARRGTSTTAIIKTLAVHPDHAGIGLGGVLTDRCQQAVAGLGFMRVIHALMLETNASQAISRRYGRTCRRYALFSRPTAP